MTVPNNNFNPRGDVFFELSHGSEWNACIGSQGTEENYVSGYMEAALELAAAVLQKRLYGQRDTLVLPILYNARHAVELTLKFIIDRLHRIDMFPQPRPKDHDIAMHYHMLTASHIGDEAMRQQLKSLKPFVDSLSAIDDDGQMLRYPETQNGEQSLSDRPLANIAQIFESLGRMNGILEKLLLRSQDLENERRTGTYTKDLSRRDLFEVAKSLPPRSSWNEEAFAVAKAHIKDRYSIGSNKFAEAVTIIEAHRELGALIGIQFNPVYLNPDSIGMAIQQWQFRHPARDANDLGIDYFDPGRFEALQAYLQVAQEVNKALIEKLSVDQLAELRALFYLGRNKVESEYYPRLLEQERRLMAQDAMKTVDHLMAKTNFRVCLADGLDRIGCTTLALSVRRPDA